MSDTRSLPCCRHATTVALALLATSFTGCASVVSGRRADVAFHTTPSQAAVTVRDHEGKVVAQTMTPGRVSLKRGRRWLRPADYQATIEKPGYVPTVVPVYGKFNPWAIGNIALGGPIGLGVDGATGALWRPQQKEFHQTLASAAETPRLDYAAQGQGAVRMTSAESQPKREGVCAPR
ncbi:MAG: hypothetical protein ACRCT8_17240 [Lacipirellulaceae bacterium]